jgi:hypothetical protein
MATLTVTARKSRNAENHRILCFAQPAIYLTAGFPSILVFSASFTKSLAIVAEQFKNGNPPPYP